MQDYWWVTRPKRKLNPIPEELAAFCSVALNGKWFHNREAHLNFEEELEHSGTKKVGERRDGSGSGGRTHAAMLYSLGLWFEKYDRVFLTLAGQAIMDGKRPVEILTRQVLRFQYPSAYAQTVRMSPRFKIRPFYFLLKLLLDDRLLYLSQQEIALIVAIEAENESTKCYEYVVNKILAYRSFGDAIFEEGYLEKHSASENNLMDVANTMMNWIDYTQLVYRETGIIRIDDAKRTEAEKLVNNMPSPIPYPMDADAYQRRYGLDPWHQKDTRDILGFDSVSSQLLDKNRLLRVFFYYSSLHPVTKIDNYIVDYVSNETGVNSKFTEKILLETYPHGALGGYLSNYRNMAFQGREEAKDFEIATTNLFHEVFGFEAIHLGQTGAKSAPDVLLLSADGGYQAIIDNKAYSQYSITGDHHNRMVHNYLNGIANYSSSKLPIGFFTYIGGGFAKNIDSQIMSEVNEAGVSGSCITVANLIHMIDRHTEKPFDHRELRELFGINRQIMISDI